MYSRTSVEKLFVLLSVIKARMIRRRKMFHIFIFRTRIVRNGKNRDVTEQTFYFSSPDFALQYEAKDAAVLVKNAWKNYGYLWKSTRVLDDINMHVEKGTM